MPPMPTKWIGPMSRGSFMADRSPGFANARALWRGYGSGANADSECRALPPRSSSPAKAGDPVNIDVSDKTAT
jgi:hypothetical protein